MALIKCPECQKEISDSAKTCPNCGYAISSPIENEKTQQVEVTGIKISKGASKKFKVIIAAVLCIVIATVLGYTIYNTQKEKKEKESAEAYRAEYIEKLKEIHSSMLYGAADAEDICNKTKSVWYNTIYKKSDSETDKYTKSKFGNYNEDFNKSLAALYDDSSIKSKLDDIRLNQDHVAELITALKNPPDDLKDAYETSNVMYDAYCAFTKLALSPTGSLTTYSQNFSQYDDDFMMQYDKLKRLIPEE